MTDGYAVAVCLSPRLRTYHVATPNAGRTAMSQKISSHRLAFIHPVHGPTTRSSTKLTSDHEPDAMPVIIAACSRGKAYEPTLSATIWKPPPMKVENPMSVIASGTDVVIVTSPSVRETTVSSRNMPTGRRLFAA